MNNINTPLKRSFTPQAILSSPEEVFRLTSTFFATYTEQGKPPTPASLAYFLGFASRTQMMQALSNDKISEESRHNLAMALTKIEAELGEQGLQDSVNVTMAKFLMSSTLGVVEKKEVNSSQDTTIRYVISTAEPASLEQATEIERLEAELERQTNAELQLSGKIKATGDTTTHHPTIEDL